MRNLGPKALIVIVLTISYSLASAQYKLYEKGFENYKAGQFDQAIVNFSEFLNKPTREKSLDVEVYYLYRQRAKRLKNLAVEMVKRKGKLPHDRKDLESIPFIGQYIANAIELIIHNQPSPLVDVNMARLLERYFGERKMADIRYDPYLQKLSYKVVDHSKAKEINWAILDYAALICSKRAPKCNMYL